MRGESARAEHSATDRGESAACWICGSRDLVLLRRGNLPDRLDSRDFAITDYRYGTTADIDLCRSCGFRQCSRLAAVLDFYEQLEDPAYEEGREQRSLQMRRLLGIAS